MCCFDESITEDAAASDILSDIALAKSENRTERTKTDEASRASKSLVRNALSGKRLCLLMFPKAAAKTPCLPAILSVRPHRSLIVERAFAAKSFRRYGRRP